MKKYFLIIAAILVSFYFIACEKKTESANLSSYSKYVNPSLGKYIIYKLDSTVTISFGTGFVVRSYLIKDSIVSVTKDNINRETFLINRYQYDTSGKIWLNSNTFYLTPSANKLEYVENNLRFISLISPIIEGYEWKGNRFISESGFPLGSFYSDWTYMYKNVGKPMQIGGVNFDSTITIQQFDSSLNKPFYRKNVFNSYNKGYEVYAKNVGLIYKDILSWEYNAFLRISGCKLVSPKQGGGYDTSSIDCNRNSEYCDSISKVANYKLINCDTAITNSYFNGYGVRLSIVSHN